MTDDINQLARRIVDQATGDRSLVELELAIGRLIAADPQWEEIIRASVEWSATLQDQGVAGQFTRESVYYRLGRTRGEGPKLTPLVKAGVLRNAWTNSRGKPYYELAEAPQTILSALGRAAGKA
jgi:hypothetical protein